MEQALCETAIKNIKSSIPILERYERELTEKVSSNASQDKLVSGTSIANGPSYIEQSSQVSSLLASSRRLIKQVEANEEG